MAHHLLPRISCYTCHSKAFFNKISYLLFIIWAVLGLYCCVRALSSCERGPSLLQYFSFSSQGLLCCGAWVLGTRLQELWPTGLAALPCANLPWPGIEPMIPALAGGLLITGPAEKSPKRSCLARGEATTKSGWSALVPNLGSWMLYLFSQPNCSLFLHGSRSQSVGLNLT